MRRLAAHILCATIHAAGAGPGLRTRSARLLLCFCLTASACFETPNYEGRLCSAADPCPAGLLCGVDLRCHNGLAETDAAVTAADSGSSDGPSPPLVFDGSSPDAEAPADSGIRPDAGPTAGPDPTRCTAAVGFPAAGWEARHFMLDMMDGFGTCLGVEDLAGEDLDRDYGMGGPVSGVTERYGSRYTSTRTILAGVQTFTVSYEDGVRIFVNGMKVFEDWGQTHAVDSTLVRTPYLAAGTYQIEVQHFHNTGPSKIIAHRTRGCGPIASPPGGWSLAYYRRTGTTVDHGECFGVEGIPADMPALDFSTNLPVPVASAGVSSGFAIDGVAHRTMRGNTTFTLTHDGGMRFSIDGTVVDDALAGPTMTPVSHQIYSTGEHDFAFELFDDPGKTNVTLRWSTLCDAPIVFSTTSWAVRYFRVIYDGTVNPPTWTLNHDDCLYAETIGTLQLDQDWPQGAPSYLATYLGTTTLWGAEYFATRTFPGAAGAVVNVNVNHDDGLRVLSDGTVVYELWTAPHVGGGTFAVTAATAHALQLDYFQNLGAAALHVNW